MSDDIVTRLEALASNYKTTEFEFAHADYETVCEASSEIERLQEQNTYLKEKLKMRIEAVKAMH